MAIINHKKQPYILQVCGLKNTGKTTFIRGFTAYLHNQGYTVAVIKHDGHEFDTTPYTEDNFLHYQAGAKASVVFSKNQWLRVQQEERSLESFIQEFMEMDYILIEGCKQASYAKIELLRKGISEVPVSNPKWRLACVVDGNYEIEERCINREDVYLFEKVVQLLKEKEGVSIV